MPPSLAIIFLLVIGCASGRVQTIDYSRSSSCCTAAMEERPNPREVADQVARQYAERPFISFRAHVEKQAAIAPGWTVREDQGIAPGTVFDVIMSASGDVRSQLYIGDQLVYESMAAVLRSELSGSGSRRYLLQEFDHRNRIRTSPRPVDKIATGTTLSDEALDHASWCASGGYTHTLIGHHGRVADLTNDDSFAYQIAHGTFARRERLPTGAKTNVFKYIQQQAACPTLGPQGQPIETKPEIWWYIYVDSERNLIVGKDGYIEKPDTKPVLVRRVRFSDIQFPTDVDEATVFRSVPEAARSYRLWKAGDPYPGDRLQPDQSTSADPD